MPILLKLGIGFVILAAIAWGFQVSLRPDRPKVEEQVNEYFKMLQAEQFGGMSSLFDADFFADNNITPEEWVEQMQQISEQLGPIQEFHLDSWADTTHTDIGRPAKFFKLNYIVTYANDVTEETFNIYLPRGSREIHILSHAINPRRLDLQLTKNEILD